MSERDELAAIIAEGADAWLDSGARPGTTAEGLAADAVLAAGYRKPRTVTTAAELDALPEGSALMEANGGRYWLKTDEDFWEGIHSAFADSASLELYGPLTVLHEGAQ